MSEHTKGELAFRLKNQDGEAVIDLGGELFALIIFPMSKDKKNIKPNAEHLVLCWNSHDALLAACERDAELANAAILATPTGDYRNKLTEINILRLQAIAKAKEQK